jgi:hypothetical protein
VRLSGGYNDAPPARREPAANPAAQRAAYRRGIAPPVLADRGLPAAVEALGERSARATLARWWGVCSGTLAERQSRYTPPG